MKHRKSPTRLWWNSVEIITFGAFLFWAAAGFFFMTQGITPKMVSHWNLPDGLIQFITFCLKNGDPILILLAFANTHLHAAYQWSAPVARNWASTIVVLSFGVEALGCHTGFPFGDYHYTANMGPQIYEVPVVIPFAWHVVVTNFLFVIRILVPYISQTLEAMAVGALCLVYDYILEPFATTVKHYWDWTNGPVAALNYPAWFVVGTLLVWFFAPTYTSRNRKDIRPWVILAVTLGIFETARYMADLGFW